MKLIAALESCIGFALFGLSSMRACLPFVPKNILTALSLPDQEELACHSWHKYSEEEFMHQRGAPEPNVCVNLLWEGGATDERSSELPL